MKDRYPFKTTERKWQDRWAREGLYTVRRAEGVPKFYCLEMFPYPSGDLHMGHVRNYAIGDVVARFKRMRGFNVLHPMGWDAFGLPAENAAIKHGIHPARWTEGNIASMRERLKRLGTSYDWTRELATSDPSYYRWTQWMFVLLYKRGLAYRKKAPVNWCPVCRTVLANEQAEGGRCWRCDSGVLKKELEQWFFKITDYADRLLDDLDELEGWPERVKVMQRNWIGRSEGLEIEFPVRGSPEPLRVFTTRHDTVFGATFMVISPQHPRVESLVAPGRGRVVREFVERAGRLEIGARAGQEERGGVWTGTFAVNPATGEDIPIWVSDYVLMEYGTGIVMGVPAHDERDYAFARQYGLPVRAVVVPAGADPDEFCREQPYTGPGIMVNSGEFNGLVNIEALDRIADKFEARGTGKRTVNYRLRDWLVSRQRYWGAPIPMIYCERCGPVLVPEEQLPVVLPVDVEVRAEGRSPLSDSPEFVKARCPGCGSRAVRETDTMDTFVCSSWYFLRYTSPGEETGPFDRREARYWMPVDQYIGGIEHAVLHLLYARFLTKVLYDAGWVEVNEPFQRLLTQGMVTRGGAAMSKSRGNVVIPDEIIEKYGADAARVFILFASPPEKDLEWTEHGIGGASRFLNRVWRIVRRYTETAGSATGGPERHSRVDEEFRRLIHRTIKKVGEDIEERFNFNTALSAIMEFVNEMYAYLEGTRGKGDLALMREAVENLLLLIAPFAPHLAEELWHSCGHQGSVHRQRWPRFDPEATVVEQVEVVVQVNGRVRDRILVPADIDEEQLVRLATSRDRVKGHTAGKEIVRTVVVPRKLVNVVTR